MIGFGHGTKESSPVEKIRIEILPCGGTVWNIGMRIYHTTGDDLFFRYGSQSQIMLKYFVEYLLKTCDLIIVL